MKARVDIKTVMHLFDKTTMHRQFIIYFSIVLFSSLFGIIFCDSDVDSYIVYKDTNLTSRQEDFIKALEENNEDMPRPCRTGKKWFILYI